MQVSMKKLGHATLFVAIFLLVAMTMYFIFTHERPDICKEVRNPDGELIATICGPGD